MTDYTVSDMAGCYKTQGRVYQTEGKLYFDWSASGVEFTANCSGDVYVTFDVESVATDETGGCFFTVIVDGVTKGRETCRLTQTGTQRIRIASGLAAGVHRFELYRQTEIGAVVGLTGVSLTGILQAAPKENDLYIEFIGDSITTAYGNLADSSTPNSGTPLYTDATQGYAYLTARKLHADFSLVAVQGIGASSGWPSYTMQQAYTKLRYPKDPSTDYSFARQPDVIVLALGTNDYHRYSTKSDTPEDVVRGFIAMLETVRQKNPVAEIVWIHGMMTDGVSMLIEDAVDLVGGKKMGIHTLRLSSSNDGGNGHPSAKQQQVFAKELSAFITELIVPTPVVQEKTTDSVTLTAVAGYEYSRDGNVWQDSPLFSGLIAEQTYTLYQRKAETADTNAGAVSVGLTVSLGGAVTVGSTATTTRTVQTTYTAPSVTAGVSAAPTVSDTTTASETVPQTTETTVTTSLTEPTETTVSFSLPKNVSDGKDGTGLLIAMIVCSVCFCAVAAGAVIVAIMRNKKR